MPSDYVVDVNDQEWRAFRWEGWPVLPRGYIFGWHGIHCKWCGGFRQNGYHEYHPPGIYLCYCVAMAECADKSTADAATYLASLPVKQ